MVWVRIGPNALRLPLDHGRNFRDGRRVFGENKTYLGLVGYIGISMIFSLLWGLLSSKNLSLASKNYFYEYHKNTIPYNLLIGALLGFAYAIFELPNSFMKRRLGIGAGKSDDGPLKYLFVFIDQADSLIGIALVVWMFYPLGWLRFLTMIFLGAATHLLINALLYIFRLRKSPI